MDALSIIQKIENLGDSTQAQVLQRFFKTGPGEYAHGDIFVGIRVPALRALAKTCRDLALTETQKLLQSPIHEARLVALLIFVQAYKAGDEVLREEIYRLYLSHTRFINNWDLVDLSAEHIVGQQLRTRPRTPLYTLASSPMLWERRIAIMATFHYIKAGEFEETLRLAAILLTDPHDLIHKAVGWMLREIGKRDFMAEQEFLRVHYRMMPRTMLRYAIEKFPEELRQHYLKGLI